MGQPASIHSWHTAFLSLTCRDLIAMEYRFAEASDVALLAQLNEQLIRDEGHRSRLSAKEVEPRLRRWFDEGYRAVLFEDGGEVVAYALYRPAESDDAGQEAIYLRQFLVRRECRGRGVGREAFGLLEERIWPRGCRITADVLCTNKSAYGFWKAVGFRDYAILMERDPAHQH